MDFFRRFLGVSASNAGAQAGPAGEAIALASPPEDSVPAELDVDAAINAHERWKARLMDYLEGRLPVGLDPDVIRRDDYSALGRWLHGVGADLLGHHPAYPLLMAPAPLLSRAGCRDGAMGPTGGVGPCGRHPQRPLPVCFEPDRAFAQVHPAGCEAGSLRSVSAAAQGCGVFVTAWQPAAVM